jgi:hypothetical protein
MRSPGSRPRISAQQIDAETQEAVLAAYSSAAEDDETRARRCLAFGDRFALGRVLG